MEVHDGKEHHVPSIEPMYARFFAFIGLFAFGMYTLVVSDNLLTLFVGWEIMGLCSYLLIGFWFGKESARAAMVKAFITTRVGDVFMLLGIAYLYAQAGTLSFRAILYNPEMLDHLAHAPSYIPGLSAAGLIGLLLFIGTVGKSAQFPLHVWLPDAMEGPTPVSAMIHAATMVSAGVYMVIRMFPLLSAGAGHGLTPAMTAMAVVGSFTALFAATIAVAQNDVKRVLAYSTISQLGYMVAALGIGAYIAAAFHLITHAFFKALLFLGSGSVIHGMEHGVLHTGDHDVDPQDMFNMGGLYKKDAAHLLDLPDRRFCPFRFPGVDSRLLVQGRDPGGRLGARPQRGLLDAGGGGFADRFLHHAPDHADLPGPRPAPKKPSMPTRPR